MKSKALALYSGILGLVGGIYLLIAPLFFLAAVTSSAAQEMASQNSEMSGYTAFTGIVVFLIPTIVKLAILVLGIVAIVYYKGEERVGTAPSVLLIVGGAVGLIPVLGWVGGILAIIGGSLFLAAQKKFNSQ